MTYSCSNAIEGSVVSHRTLRIEWLFFLDKFDLGESDTFSAGEAFFSKMTSGHERITWGTTANFFTQHQRA